MRVRSANGAAGNYELMVARQEYRVPLRLAARTTPNAVRFTFPTAPGRNYQLEGRSEWGPQFPWTPVSGDWPGDGDLADIAYQVGPGGGCRYFRLRSTGP